MAVQFKTNGINQVVAPRNSAAGKENLQEVTKHKSILSFTVRNGVTKGGTTLVCLRAWAKLKDMTINFCFSHCKQAFVKEVNRKQAKTKTRIARFATLAAVYTSQHCIYFSTLDQNESFNI